MIAALIEAAPTFWLSLKLATLVSLILLAIGLPLGWLSAKRRFCCQALLEGVLFLPLVLPPTVLGFYLLLLLGPEGPIKRLFGRTLAFHFEGLVVAGVIFSLPFALAAFREAFAALPDDLVETARTLGAGPVKVWRAVVLPLVWPGVLSGLLLAFAHTLGEFGVVLMVGGAIPGETRVVSIYLYDLVEALDFGRAHVVAGALLLFSLGLLLLVRRLEARWKSATGS